MVQIQTLEQEDAKRPSREHDSLVRERTSLINRIQGCEARFAVHGPQVPL
jgi:transposase